MAKIATLAGVAEKNECDGTHFLFVNFDGLTYPVQLDPTQISSLIARLQEAAVDRSAQVGQRGVVLLQFEATDFELAHQGREVGLVVTSTQAGKMVFRFGDALLLQLQAELDRMRTYRNEPSSVQ